MGDTPDGGNYGSVWIDYDNDCDIDLFIAKCRGGDSPANINQMHRNNGDGTYTEVGAEIGLADNVQTWSSAWADYDNDGDMDVVVGASSFANGGHKVMINDGIGFFTDQTAGSGFDVNPNLSIEWAPGDFNNDGWVDVMGGGQILINNGNLTFTPTQVAFSAGPIGDLNDDGFLDVVTGGTRFMNTPNGNHFINLNMLGTESNRNGIGARVTLYTPSGEQIRDVRSGEGFRYMSSLNVHFGIGMDEQINKITICWPSGITDEILNPQIDQTLLIVEGQNEVSMDEANASFLQLLPNPAQHQIAVLGAQFIRSVKAYDVSGRQVALPAMQGAAYSVEHLLPGMYFIQVETGNGVESLPFIKE
jgi:urease beta subunit